MDGPSFLMTKTYGSAMVTKKRFCKIIPVWWTFGFIIGLFCGFSAWALEWQGISAQINSLIKYQYQWSDDPKAPFTSDEDSDQDFYQLLGIEADLPWQELHFSFYGRYAKDLDGSSEGSLYQDLVETSPERQRLDIYYAYFERKDWGPGLDVRLGRMYIYGADVVHLDGLSVSRAGLVKSWIDLEVFGGLIVQMYSNLSQDVVGGFNLDLKPRRDLFLSLKSVFYRETSYRLDWSWHLREGVKWAGYWELINDHSRNLNIDFLVRVPQTGTYLGVNLYRRFRVARDTEDDFLYDYTFSIGDGLKDDIRRLYLSQEAAYWEINFSVTQPVPHLKGLVLYGKATWRWLVHDESDEDFYNTDFTKYTLGFSWEEPWELKGFSVNAGFSHWREDRDLGVIYEAESFSYFLDLKQAFRDRAEVKAGFYYKNQDINSLIEREGSKVFYGAFKYFLDGTQRNRWVEVRYEYNEADYFKQFGFSSLNLISLNLGIKF